MWPYTPWFGGGPIGIGGGTPYSFDPFNAGNPGAGVPIGNGGGGWLGGVGDAIEDLADIVGDVSDIIDIFGGGSGGGSGTGTGSPFPPSGSTGPTPFSGLVGNIGGGDSAVLVANIGNQSADEAAFLEFLRAIGVAASIIGWLWENPPITWPKIAADMFAAWFNQGRPSQPESVITPLVPVEWKSGGSTTGSPLPVPAPGIPSFGQQGVAPMAMQAYATQVYKAPKGYVTVRVPDGAGGFTKMFVLKKVAVAMGLYKNRKKAPITGKEYAYIKKAKAWETKLARMLGDSCNFKVTKKR